MLNLTNFVDDGDGGEELFKYVDLGMRDKVRAADKPAVKGKDGDCSIRVMINQIKLNFNINVLE